jgi:hypothetical protein
MNLKATAGWYRATRYLSSVRAEADYRELSGYVTNHAPSEVAAYRLEFGPSEQVLVCIGFGDLPPAEHQDRIAQLLDGGDLVQLDPGTVQRLWAAWSERHTLGNLS